MRKRAIALAAALSIGLTAVVFAEGFLDKYFAGRVVAQNISAVNTDVAMIVRYVGSNKFAKLAVETDGNLTFTQDDVDGTTASTELECPVSGALGGVIDVSDNACDTFGEVVNVINASTGWRAVLVGALATDTTDGASNGGGLKDVAASQNVQRVEGMPLYAETTSNLKVISVALTQFLSAADYLGGGTGVNAGTPFKNPFNGFRTALTYLYFLATDSGTSIRLTVYSVKGNFSPARKYTETVTTLYDEPGISSTKTLALGGVLGSWGLFGRQDEKIVVRIKGTTTLTSPTIVATGVEYEYR
jgi:hypothetical protein